MKVNMYKWTMVALAGSAAALMGCESQSAGSGEYGGTAPHGRPGATYDVKGAPKAAEAPAQKSAAKEETKAPAQPAKSEAAAAPKAAPTAGSVQYLPTGDRATSALMIEKIY
ncbi:MAG: hypothetical protein RL689_2152, partial [Planctomycetota bacterium]